MHRLWDALRPELLALLMGRTSLHEVFVAHGAQACLHALRWSVRSDASESLVCDWFARGALGSDLALRQVTCQVLPECDFDMTARLVRHFKHEHDRLPRSCRTAIVRSLRQLESEPGRELLVALHYDALRYLYATLHIKPSAAMQISLFEARRPDRAVNHEMSQQGSSTMWSIPRDRSAVQIYVESSRYVDDAMLEAVKFLLCDVTRRGIFECELYEVTEGARRVYEAVASVEGWQDAMTRMRPRGEVGDARALELMIEHAYRSAPYPVGHIIYVCDARRVTREDAVAFGRRVASHGDAYGVCIVRWGASTQDFVLDDGRVCAWMCEDAWQLVDTMSYMLI